MSRSKLMKAAQFLRELVEDPCCWIAITWILPIPVIFLVYAALTGSTVAIVLLALIALAMIVLLVRAAGPIARRFVNEWRTGSDDDG